MKCKEDYRWSGSKVLYLSDGLRCGIKKTVRRMRFISIFLASFWVLSAAWAQVYEWKAEGNPVVRHKYTADPATLVYKNTLWIFAGEDFEGNQQRTHMENWCVFATTDLVHYREYPVPLRADEFKWSSGIAYASQVVERNGTFYWYVSTDHTGIGVAVSDRPEGPYKDALGKPLLTVSDCFASQKQWACIDPTVLIDDDGQAWIFWGNGECYYARLKENMIEIEGEIRQVNFEGFVFEEAPWVHKRGDKYYLSYASGFPERIAYAMADSIEGPWVYQGILNEWAGNSSSNHQAIQEYKGRWYFFYHNGVLKGGTSCSRSVCADYLYYNADGTMRRVQMTSEGVLPVVK